VTRSGQGKVNWNGLEWTTNHGKWISGLVWIRVGRDCELEWTGVGSAIDCGLDHGLEWNTHCGKWLEWMTALEFNIDWRGPFSGVDRIEKCTALDHGLCTMDWSALCSGL